MVAEQGGLDKPGQLRIPPRGREERTRRVLWRGGIGWLAVFLSLLLWWAVGYRALVSRLAEWQFWAFGFYYPIVTVVLLLLLFGLPVMLVMLVYRGRRRERIPMTPRRAAVRARRLGTGLGILGAICLAVALASLLAMAWLPDASGRRRDVVVSANGPPWIAEGRARLIGVPDLNEISVFDERMLLVRRERWFAPVYPVSTAHERGEAQFLIEVTPVRYPDRVTFLVPDDGVLRHDALPGEIIHLYRENGIAVAKKPYVLLRSDDSVRWRHLMASAQAGLAAAALFGFSWNERRRARRLMRLSEQERTAMRERVQG